MFRAKKGSWFTFATSELSLRELVERVPDLFNQETSFWWLDEGFSGDAPEIRRLSLHTSIEAGRDSFLPNFNNKTWDEQKALLGKNEQVPSARDVIDGMIQYYLKTRKRIFQDFLVRTSDVSSHGGRILVGNFARDGLHVSQDEDNLRYSFIGLAVCRKA